MERLGNCMYNQICKYEQECSNTCERYVRTKYLLGISNIPESRVGVNELEPDKQDLQKFRQLGDIRTNIEDFVANGRILYLWSDYCGNGKTTWSIKMALQYINAIWKYHYENAPVVFISVPDFLFKIKSFNNEYLVNEAYELRRKAEKADLVIFDDIGLDYVSKYDYMAIFSLIDVLCLHETSMIFTSNFSKEELTEQFGPRLPSRICNDYVIQLKGEDRRENK